ncbi:MAG: lipase [Myxococcota bacterium]
MKLTRQAVIFSASFGLFATACATDAEEFVSDQDLTSADLINCTSTQGAQAPVGLSTHFRDWLAQSAYADYDFARTDIDGGSFGGFAGDSDCISRQPVIFVHGNSDRALGGTIGGWADSVDYFLSQGYRGAEIYATTYGPASALQSSNYYHSRENIMQVRAFIEAVLEYTGADQVDVISHSMGVTMSRKAIKGGWASDLADGGDYYVGDPLTQRIDTFVGIAGGNRGLSTCYLTPGVPTCAATNGFYPGYVWFGYILGVSNFLDDLNGEVGYEGDYRYAIWSTVDEVVGGACLVWGNNTCRIPGQTDEKRYTTFPYGHIGVRDQTVEVQYDMVTEHVVP